MDTTGACQLYGDDWFIESPSKNHKSSKLNMKSTICHEFPRPNLLEGPKDGKIKENVNFFFIQKSSNDGCNHKRL